MTVSRVLNGERHVSAQARARVQDAIEALDFQRNAFARGLPGSRSFLICLVIPEMIPAYVAEFQHGAIECCRAKGYHLVVLPYDDGADNPVEVVAGALASLRPDGFLLLPSITDDPAVLDMLDRSETPYVRMAPLTQPERASSISMDDVEAARRMTTALLDLGHRRIGFFTGPPDHAASVWRLEGYRLALEARGLAMEPWLVRSGEGVFEGDETEVIALLDEPDPPSAVFAFNDEIALAVMAVAYRRGLSVPEDLSVAGFDDSELSRLSWPPLTTVRQPIFAMAGAAAELVIAQAEAGTRRVEHRRLDFDLVFRGTIAPPRG
jgi:LacI family transcriptional regulator